MAVEHVTDQAVGLATRQVIDTHSHWRPPGYVELMLAAAERDPEFRRRFSLSVRSAAEARRKAPEESLAEKIADLDMGGVDVALISLPPPGANFVHQQISERVASEMNDALADTAARSNGRIRALISLPLPAVAASLAELDRFGGDPGVAGVQLISNIGSRDVAPDRSEEVLARAAELGLPVVLHPAVESGVETLDDWMLDASLSPVVTSSLAAARLVLSGVLDRVPDLNVVVPHLGGVLPYLTQRFVDFGTGSAEHDLVYYLRHRLFVDTCSYHPPAMRCAIATLGADRLVLGSDHPSRGAVGRAVADVRGHFETDQEASAVLGGTAATLFRLAVSEPHRHGVDYG
ncbi:amidohydrolase family protein [Nocardioides massiliensis]|uniref:Aminocarboxymuconate-semialdehyde decarboxylase n=1 Tax=Nocardioides massiliensis TaxID=1325935 RepID=A0ABT9NK31_9ACTN|nr:amidohydrolase family protein [Nocardioides massiliensis]MDP9820781.1 aminocarboxymuconate-semialdehyde decarboxylase [Nocardioides massiliensis]